MEWLNLHSSTLDSPEVVGSDPVERGTWLMLLRYCIGQENGGTIEACRGWKDRKWQQLVRVTQKEVSIVSELWQWQGDSLIVTHYPNEKEREVKAKRDNAKTNGLRGGRPKKPPEETNTGLNSETKEKPILVISEKAEGEGEGKEKGKEGERKEGEAREESPPSDFSEPPEQITAKINGVRPQWAKAPHLTSQEQHDLYTALGGFRAINPAQWQAVTLWAASPQGRDDWTVKTRSRFIANYSEALMKADEWHAGELEPQDHLSLGGRKAFSTTIV